MSEHSDDLALFVIYRHPADFPDKYVVRKWIMDRPTHEFQLYEFLEEARRPLEKLGLVCLNRAELDDPCIVETWL